MSVRTSIPLSLKMCRGKSDCIYSPCPNLCYPTNTLLRNLEGSQICLSEDSGSGNGRRLNFATLQNPSDWPHFDSAALFQKNKPVESFIFARASFSSCWISLIKMYGFSHCYWHVKLHIKCIKETKECSITARERRKAEGLKLMRTRHHRE